MPTYLIDAFVTIKASNPLSAAKDHSVTIPFRTPGSGEYLSGVNAQPLSSVDLYPDSLDKLEAFDAAEKHAQTPDGEEVCFPI